MHLNGPFFCCSKQIDRPSRLITSIKSLFMRKHCVMCDVRGYTGVAKWTGAGFPFHYILPSGIYILAHFRFARTHSAVTPIYKCLSIYHNNTGRFFGRHLKPIVMILVVFWVCWNGFRTICIHTPLEQLNGRWTNSDHLTAVSARNLCNWFLNLAACHVPPDV